MSSRLTLLRAAVLLLSAVLPSVAAAYDVDSHRELGSKAVERSETLSRTLRHDLQFDKGVDTIFRADARFGPVERTVERWIREGARLEDVPDWRVVKHFHDPLRPWASAGLWLVGHLSPFESSVVWSQAPVQTLRDVDIGGTWSWPVTRRRYFEALTAQTEGARSAAFADTFRALGQLTHLIQDATVPAHTRNDAHPSIPVGGRMIPVNHDWYEAWIEQTRRAGTDLFPEILGRPHVTPSVGVFAPTGDAAAPVPIAGLLDTRRLALSGVAPGFDDRATGVAEFTSANFLSRSTLFGERPLPAREALGLGFLERQGARFRRYFPKTRAGAVEIAHFVAEGALYEPLRGTLGAAPRHGFTLDRRVHEAYAHHLVPRAVGYSAALLDYFFRGRLDVDLVLEASDPGLARLTGRNLSPDPLGHGTVRLWADRATGREPVAAVDPVVVADVGPGQALTSGRFALPEDAERFVAVYQGSLGHETVTADGRSPGAVVGRVLGGVRVEQVFADGGRWKIRTPRGVLVTRLTADEYARVTWGDDEDVLVAWARGTPDRPARVDTFRVAREPDSREPFGEGDPPAAVLLGLRTAPLALAEPPLVTVVDFEQIVDYRQQIGRYTRTGFAEWVPRWPFGLVDGHYATVGVPVVDPIQFSTVHAATRRFAAEIPIVLDAAHDLDGGGVQAPYVWRWVDVFARGDGRLLGLAVVHLTTPPAAPAVEPFFVVDPSGAVVRQGEVRLDPAFPSEVTPLLWALVDLERGSVVASTAGPRIRLSTRSDREGSPWSSGSGSTPSGLYVRIVTQLSGGPDAGTLDLGWAAQPLLSRSLPPTVGLTELGTRAGLRELTADGWLRDELRAALARAGLHDLAIRETEQARLYTYDCVTAIVTGDQDCLALRVVTTVGSPVASPVRLTDAARTRPTGGGERLVLFGDAERAEGLTSHLVVWEPDVLGASVRLGLPAGTNRLVRSASSGGAMVFARPRTGTRGSYWVPLEGAEPPVFFPNVDFRFGFVALEPGHLYGTSPMRFYRLAPPLVATALPRRLAPVAGAPDGGYHTLRVP